MDRTIIFSVASESFDLPNQALESFRLHCKSGALPLHLRLDRFSAGSISDGTCVAVARGARYFSDMHGAFAVAAAPAEHTAADASGGGAAGAGAGGGGGGGKVMRQQASTIKPLSTHGRR